MRNGKQNHGMVAGSRKVGYKRYIGIITRDRLTDIGSGFLKHENEIVSRVWDREGLPFASDDTARKYAKRAMIKLIELERKGETI